MKPPAIPIHRILMIDDDEEDFFLFKEAVKAINKDITVSFLQDCDKDPTHFPWLQPDIIFLDLNMPRCNGFECLRKLKTGEHKDVPVVIFTTSRNQGHIDKAYECGAALFLAKPFSFTDLVNALKGILQLNWLDPSSITKNYFNNGTYQAYSVG